MKKRPVAWMVECERLNDGQWVSERMVYTNAEHAAEEYDVSSGSPNCRNVRGPVALAERD